MILSLTTQTEKRNVQTPLKKEVGGSKRLKQTLKNQVDSLERALKGSTLSGDQLKKKKMLEISISRGEGGKICLSQYLHECGFSYESQSVMVSLKSVKKYMINYLVSLFLKKSDNPLMEKRLHASVLRRISNRWGVIKDIVTKVCPALTTEEFVLGLFKNKGAGYESLIIFLDLFESKVSLFRYEDISVRRYPEYKELKYPFSKERLGSDFFEVAKKGGSLSLKGFINMFLPSSGEVSEWEQMTRCVWEREDDGSNLSEEIVLNHFKRCLKTNSGSRNKQAFMASLMNKDLILDGEEVSLFDFLRSDYGGNLSTVDAMSLLARCIGVHGGSKNQQAFVECLNKPEIVVGGKKMSLYQFLMSAQGGNLSTSDAMHLLSKCIGNGGGSRNKQAFVECLNKPEIVVDGKKMSLYQFLMSAQGGNLSASDAINWILKCIGYDGGSKNKQAFIECLSKSEINVDGKRQSLYKYLLSFMSEREGGAQVSDVLQMIIKCISSEGGCKNKQALIECFCKKEIDLSGQKVSLYSVLISESGGCLSSFDAMSVIIKCIGKSGGCNNKQALIDSFCALEINLGGEKVSLKKFLCSKLGGGLSLRDTVQVIVRCIGVDGGAKSKQSFLDCLESPEIDLDGEVVSLYDFLKSGNGGGLSASQAIKIIVKCISHNGGSKNKQALMECFCKQEIFLDQEKVSLYKFLISERGGGLSEHEAVQVITRSINADGGCNNKQALVDCFCKIEINMDGKRASLYNFLCSKQGGGLRSFEAIQMISRFIGENGGSKNKQAFIDCLNKEEIYLEGQWVSLFKFLVSDKRCGFSPYEAIDIIAKCTSQMGGSKNKQMLLECLNLKLIDVRGLSLYEAFLSGSMTFKEALFLCFIFSVNRGVLNTKDVLGLFSLKTEDESDSSVIEVLNSLGISCYDTLIKLTTKVLNYPNVSTEMKRLHFTSSCQSLVDMFVDAEGFFIEKVQEHLDCEIPDLADQCIDACVLYTGKDIYHELKARETLIIDWVSQFVDSYQLSRKSLSIILHIQSLDELKSLIYLCKREMEIREVRTVNADYCEERLRDSLLILLNCKQVTIQAIQKYESILLNWFDLKMLSYLFVDRLNNMKMEKSIVYFFENKKGMYGLIPQINLRNIFLIYMGLSSMATVSHLPLKIEDLASFFEFLGEDVAETMRAEKNSDLYSKYTLYSRLSKQEKDKLSKLSARMKNEGLTKENLTQEEVTFLIRIKYRLPKDIVIAWSDLSILKNDEKGCCVLNKTDYSNGVFALAYLHKVMDFLSAECQVVQQNDSVVFKSIGRKKCKFPLFKIQLHRDGFVFEGESVVSVESFYMQSGLDDYLSLAASFCEQKRLMRAPSSDKESPCVFKKNQKRTKGGEGGEELDQKSRKRKGVCVECEGPPPKEMKMITSTGVFNSSETVLRGDILNKKNNEFLAIRIPEFEDMTYLPPKTMRSLCEY